MKVFGCYRQGGYSGGMILVAADTVMDAYNLYMNDDNYDWMHGEIDGESMYNYYPFEKWQEFDKLTANCDEAQVICEDGYTE